MMFYIFPMLIYLTVINFETPSVLYSFIRFFTLLLLILDINSAKPRIHSRITSSLMFNSTEFQVSL